MTDKPIFTAMFQYGKDSFSIIHSKTDNPQVGDYANVHHKTALHKKERETNALKIYEVTETRNHKTDPKNKISIVRCEPQTISEE